MPWRDRSPKRSRPRLTRYERGELDRVATNNGDAYNCYLRAVALFLRPTSNDDSGLVEPKRVLEEALRLDPDYTDALALLSRANTWMYFDSRSPVDGADAKQAFERALTIDPQVARGATRTGPVSRSMSPMIWVWR